MYESELTKFMRCHHTGKQHRVDERLAHALYVVGRHYSGRRIEVFSGSVPLGRNPKVNLLAALAERAASDYLLVSDSNVRVGPSYLRETAAELRDERVGLVTNFIVAEEGEGLGARLEGMHLNSFVVCDGAVARSGRPLVRHRQIDALPQPRLLKPPPRRGGGWGWGEAERQLNPTCRRPRREKNPAAAR